LQVVGSLKSKERSGAFWSIRSEISDFGLPDMLPCPESKTKALAETPTRLRRMPEVLQERLINWGYAVTDAGMRQYWDEAVTAPTSFPYPRSGVG
jgi:NTE family protein